MRETNESRVQVPRDSSQENTVEPSKAAAAILLRDDDAQAESKLQVIMGQRSPDSRNLPGFWVFPGGMVESDDHDTGSANARFRNTALRELAEETGIELDGPDSLIPFARWITPAELGVRFDAHFYIAPAPPEASPKPDRMEIVDARWLQPQEALDQHQAGEMKMIFPTLKQLEDLARFSTVREVLEDAPTRSMEPVQPRAVVENEKVRIVLPGEPGYN